MTQISTVVCTHCDHCVVLNSKVIGRGRPGGLNPRSKSKKLGELYNGVIPSEPRNSSIASHVNGAHYMDAAGYIIYLTVFMEMQHNRLCHILRWLFMRQLTWQQHFGENCPTASLSDLLMYSVIIYLKLRTICTTN
jgi:hypothetical protein